MFGFGGSNIGLLEREGVNDLVKTLAEAAASELGYGVANKHHDSAELMAFLQKIDIMPFHPESVEKYKKAQVRSASGTFDRLAVWWEKIDSRTVELVSLAAFLLSIVSITVSITSASLGGWTTFCVSTPLALCSLPGFVLCMFCNTHSITLPEWHLLELRYYDKAIPEYALQTALDIKKRFPEAVFYVEWLKPGRVERQKDPFLVLGYRNRFYHLEVWGEPRFKGKREV